MSFPKYTEYKDSGVEWLGEVPAHWEILPFFSRFIENKRSNKGMIEDNLLSLSYGRVIKKDINTLDGLLPESFETYQIIHPDDIIFRLTDLQNDKRSLRSSISEERGIITSAYLSVSAKKISSRFSSYLFRSYDLTKVFYAMGGGLRQSMKYGDMKWIPILTPPESEQLNIATFLDHETARIDALVEEQKRLIELLKEKRQAVISHAVTKGLDPDVPMKDSGVEWLGTVPAHWEVVKVRRILIDHKQGYYSSEDYVDDGIKLLRITDLKSLGGVDIKDCPKVKETKQTDSFLLQSGDFVFARTGGAGLFGLIEKISEPLLYASYLIRFRFKRAIIASFLRNYFLSEAFQEPLSQQVHGGVNQNVHAEDIKNQYVALPPINEQESIANHLESWLEGEAKLQESAIRSIALLNERRSALISAAVTGKIDVRGWQVDQQSEQPELLKAAEARATYG